MFADMTNWSDVKNTQAFKSDFFTSQDDMTLSSGGLSRLMHGRRSE
ncbi:MAG: hypothetical protein ACJAYR_003554 [Sneathiella sp.]|jgi:hypothetical protein